MSEPLSDGARDPRSLSKEDIESALSLDPSTASIPPLSTAPMTDYSGASSTAQTAAPPGTTLSTPPPGSAASDAGSDVERGNPTAKTILSNEDRRSSEGSSDASAKGINSILSQDGLPDEDKMVHKQQSGGPSLEQMLKVQVDKAMSTLRQKDDKMRWIDFPGKYKGIRGSIANIQRPQRDELLNDLHGKVCLEIASLIDDLEVDHALASTLAGWNPWYPGKLPILETEVEKLERRDIDVKANFVIVKEFSLEQWINRSVPMKPWKAPLPV